LALASYTSYRSRRNPTLFGLGSAGQPCYFQADFPEFHHHRSLVHRLPTFDPPLTLVSTSWLTTDHRIRDSLAPGLLASRHLAFHLAYAKPACLLISLVADIRLFRFSLVSDRPLETPRFRRRLVLSWNLRPVQSSHRMRIAAIGSAFPLRRRTIPRPCGFSHAARPEPFAQFRSRLSSGSAFLQSLARPVLAQRAAGRRHSRLLS
jgi:hypothetical protein